MIPIGEAPDEAAHVRYAEFIWTQQRLPDEQDLVQSNLAEGFQAPLYHSLIALLIAPTGFHDQDIVWVDNPNFAGSSTPGLVSKTDPEATRRLTPTQTWLAYWVLRLPNALFGALMVWWCYRAVAMLTGVPQLSLMIVGLWASTTGATFMAGVVGNDMLAATLSALALLLFVKARRDSSLRGYVWASVVLSLAVLTKMTALMLWVGYWAWLAWRAYRTRDWKPLLIVTLVPLVLSGWSIFRSLTLHERWALDDRVVSLSGGLIPYAKSWFIVFVKTIQLTLTTGVGVVGLADVYMPGWYYGLFFGIAALILIYAWRLLKFRQWNESTVWSVPSLIGVVLLFLLSLHWFRESGECMHSRLFFPYLPGIFLLCASAMKSADDRAIMSPSRQRLATIAGIAAIIVLLVPDTVWTRFLAPLVSWAKVDRPVSEYTALLDRWLVAAGVTLLILVVWNRWGTSWWSRLRAGQPARIATTVLLPLFALNLLLLFFYVRQFYW